MTYASEPWENVAWSHFDLVGIDLYSDADNRDTYREQASTYSAHQKPVVVTESGCYTYRGAQDRGTLGWAIVDRSVWPPRLMEDVIRDEHVQAEDLMQVLSIRDEEQVDGAFWCTVAGFGYP